jgi:hypothetical protein
LVEEGLEHVLAERTSQKPFKLKKLKSDGGGFQQGFDESGWGKIRDEIYHGRGS